MLYVYLFKYFLIKSVSHLNVDLRGHFSTSNNKKSYYMKN